MGRTSATVLLAGVGLLLAAAAAAPAAGPTGVWMAVRIDLTQGPVDIEGSAETDACYQVPTCVAAAGSMLSSGPWGGGMAWGNGFSPRVEVASAPAGLAVEVITPLLVDQGGGVRVWGTIDEEGEDWYMLFLGAQSNAPRVQLTVDPPSAILGFAGGTDLHADDAFDFPAAAHASVGAATAGVLYERRIQADGGLMAIYFPQASPFNVPEIGGGVEGPQGPLPCLNGATFLGLVDYCEWSAVNGGPGAYKFRMAERAGLDLHQPVLLWVDHPPV